MVGRVYVCRAKVWGIPAPLPEGLDTASSTVVVDASEDVDPVSLGLRGT